jgi:tetratricopeptide (TPR) repeat protein
MRARNIPAQIPSATAPRVHDVRRLLNLLLSLLVLCASLLHAQVSKHLPIYDAQERVVYGKVRMADGSSPPELVTMEAICGGVAYPVAVTDTQGNFQVVLSSGGPRFSDTDYATSDNAVPVLAECEFRAQLPGYRSQHATPRWLKEMVNISTISVGTILLSRPGVGESPPAPPELTSKDAKAAYKKGGAAMVSGKWNDAKSQFEKVASLQPEYFGAWIGLGLAQEALRKWSDAEAAYQKALALHPKAADAYIRIARVGAKTGNWKQAAEYSEAAMGLDPHHLVEGYALCALANYKLGQMEIAQSSARAGLKLDTTEYPELWLIMALTQAQQKRYADAEASLRQYLDRVPRAQSVKEVQAALLELQSALAAK